MNAKTLKSPGPKRTLADWLPMAAGLLLLLGVVAIFLWWLFKDPVSTRRPVADTPMLMLPPPPPPPPEPEVQPEPEPEPEEPMPEPEPMEEEAPVPTEEDEPAPDVSDPVTMDADAQAGTDSWNIAKGSGGGSVGSGAAGNASYGRYLGYALHQAILKDERLKRMAYQLLLDVWLEPDGTISRVDLVRGSGNEQADESLLEALQGHRLDERPPASLRFPARVLIQSRRPVS